ncbi:hypothetical protein L0128_05125 [candidate division KSB1 bacterium]|nr:hypothetical protein [candidate division KSB1 bacterium]
MRNRIWCCGLLLLMFTPIVRSGNAWQFHGRLSNAFYAYEIRDEKQSNLYQYVNANLRKADWAGLEVMTSFRTLTDLNENLSADARYHFYTLNLGMTGLFGKRLDFRLGRQFLHPGTILGGLDGLSATVHLSRQIEWGLYAGVESNFARSAKIYKLADSRVLGSQFQWQNLLKSKWQLFYLQKANDAETYWQLAGLNFDNSWLPRTRLQLQTHYDLQNSRLHRLWLAGQYQLAPRLSLAAHFKQQYPQVYANSFYTIFELEGYQQYRFTGAYNFWRDFYLNGTYQLLKLASENAHQLWFTASNANGSIGLIYESGYTGEQIGVVMDYAVTVFDKFTASASVDYSRYRTEEIYEFEQQMGNAVRLSYRITPRFLVDVEYQWLTNRFQESDSRFLNHIHFSW